jgi:hypothetical protein
MNYLDANVPMYTALREGSTLVHPAPMYTASDAYSDHCISMFDLIHLATLRQAGTLASKLTLQHTLQIRLFPES